VIPKGSVELLPRRASVQRSTNWLNTTVLHPAVLAMNQMRRLPGFIRQFMDGMDGTIREPLNGQQYFQHQTSMIEVLIQRSGPTRMIAHCWHNQQAVSGWYKSLAGLHQNSNIPSIFPGQENLLLPRLCWQKCSRRPS